MKNYNISCVIVTYNRKMLLKRCLDAVNSQMFKPKTVYIIDNASTDGTIDSTKEWGYYNCTHAGVEYKYVLNSINEGGAGGFFLGMKTAFEAEHPDALWVMDDDGEPEKDCLKELVLYLGRYHFISPFVISNADKTRTSFFRCSIADFSKRFTKGIFVGDANPFNGVLFSKELISSIGYPKREMFIWGDEQNYMHRAKLAGFELCIIEKAIHLHPEDRQKRTIYKGREFVDIAQPWKLYCYFRNTWYNNLRFGRRGFIYQLFRSFKYGYLTCRFYKDTYGKMYFKLIVDAIYCAIVGNFQRLYKYRNM